ncbi:GIY-YIG nuclease family protein [Hyphomonas sp. L-53-1-40]|uniref:GIY-YIG nuclease family protein n=1 Tax=Hyphomonas sp. L-53-1-40 TaxID=1207058 RepID=UPI0012EC78CD|nr:GIY-YIG nuclease family protein [Hyphomonas sp. L-53-1-40]
MAKLSEAQIQFLKAHKIDPSLLYDASGQSSSDWRGAMKKIGKKFAFGTSPCGAEGHTLRSRHGHCIQCDPSRIAYALRFSKPGHVYILGSLTGKLIKIGVTTELASRVANVVSMQYGNASDWQPLAVTEKINGAGKIEAAAHNILEAHRVTGKSCRAGETHITYELYSCDYNNAKSALESAVPEGTKIFTKASQPVLSAFKGLERAA